MPSKPPSEFALTVNEMKFLAVVTFACVREYRTRTVPRPSLLEHEPARVVAGRLQHRERLIERQILETRAAIESASPPAAAFAGATQVVIRRPRVEPDRDGRRGRRRLPPPSSEDELWHASSSTNAATSNEDGPARLAAT